MAEGAGIGGPGGEGGLLCGELVVVEVGERIIKKRLMMMEKQAKLFLIKCFIWKNDDCGMLDPAGSQAGQR